MRPRTLRCALAHQVLYKLPRDKCAACAGLMVGCMFEHAGSLNGQRALSCNLLLCHLQLFSTASFLVLGHQALSGSLHDHASLTKHSPQAWLVVVLCLADSGG